jgi:hypothetical protein
MFEVGKESCFLWSNKACGSALPLHSTSGEWRNRAAILWTEEHTVDIFSKPLSPDKFVYFRDKAGVISSVTIKWGGLMLISSILDIKLESTLWNKVNVLWLYFRLDIMIF